VFITHRSSFIISYMLSNILAAALAATIVLSVPLHILLRATNHRYNAWWIRERLLLRPTDLLAKPRHKP
jgi:hypothetical protein